MSVKLQSAVVDNGSRTVLHSVGQGSTHILVSERSGPEKPNRVPPLVSEQSETRGKIQGYGLMGSVSVVSGVGN